jgi:hypothetical protein
MRYVIVFRSNYRFLRSLADPTKIQVFNTYADADGVASVLGLDAAILEVSKRLSA